MTHDNQVNIGSVGTGNTISITQTQAPDAPHIEYMVDKKSVRNLSKTYVNKGVFAFYGALLLPILAIVADALGVLSFLGVQTRWVMAVVLPAAIFGALLNNTRRKIAQTTFNPNTAAFIDGNWIEQDERGGYIRYQKTAPCIYPKCSGTVFVRTAPPRELPNHTLIGVCNVGGHRHTYTVDFNGIGFPEQFDWRPIEDKHNK
jgi:hypothetical protein